MIKTKAVWNEKIIPDGFLRVTALNSLALAPETEMDCKFPGGEASALLPSC
jgi:hypothetical protein